MALSLYKQQLWVEISWNLPFLAIPALIGTSEKYAAILTSLTRIYIRGRAYFRFFFTYSMAIALTPLSSSVTPDNGTNRNGTGTRQSCRLTPGRVLRMTFAYQAAKAISGKSWIGLFEAELGPFIKLIEGAAIATQFVFAIDHPV